MSAKQRNRVRIAGRGDTTLVLGHGFGCNQSAWRRVVPLLEPDFRLVLYDVTGCGESDRQAYDPQRYDTLERHALDLIEVIREVAVGPVCFAGHSMSGVIGLLAAIQEPRRFAKLVTVAGSACYTNEDGYVGGSERSQLEELVRNMTNDYHGWCSSQVPVVLCEPADAPLTRELIATFQSAEPAIAHHLARVAFLADVRAALPRVPCETLVLQAQHDPLVPMEAAEYLAANLPDAQLQLVVGRGGHFPHLGAPHEVARALCEFAAPPHAACHALG